MPLITPTPQTALPDGAPLVTHPRQDWIAAYARGWHALAERMQQTEPHPSPAEILWSAYCGRYAWRSQPLLARIDHALTSIRKTPSPAVGLLALTEWALHRLRGDGDRVRRLLDPLAEALRDAACRARTDDDWLWIGVGLRSLSWMATSVGQPPPAWDALDRHLSPAPASLDAELLHIWRTEQTPVRQRLIDRCLGQIEEGVDGAATPAQIQRCLLLLVLLRQRQQPEQAHALATASLAACSSAPSLVGYVPPLLLDGVLGCDPDAEALQLSWWLTESPPFAVRRYPLAGSALDLHAVAERGGGTQVQIRCDAPVALEILTGETLYLERLAPGSHALTLTVLDRTEVKIVNTDEEEHRYSFVNTNSKDPE